MATFESTLPAPSGKEICQSLFDSKDFKQTLKELTDTELAKVIAHVTGSPVGSMKWIINAGARLEASNRFSTQNASS